MRATMKSVAAVAVAGLVAACSTTSGFKPDVAGYRAAVNDTRLRAGLIGPVSQADFDRLLKADMHICDMKPDEFQLTYAILKDNGAASGMRRAVSYLCPRHQVDVDTIDRR